MTEVSTAQQPVLVVMGVSGSGKSTIAALLAARLGWDLQEGDDLHSTANVAKMAAGIPLTDEDRMPWLDTVASWITSHTAAGLPGIVTCSALPGSPVTIDGTIVTAVAPLPITTTFLPV